MEGSNGEDFNLIEQYLTNALDELRRRRSEGSNQNSDAPSPSNMQINLQSSLPNLEQRQEFLERSPRSSLTPRTFTGEVRRLFSPYPESVARRRNTVGPPSRSMYRQAFYCLGGPEDIKVPTSERKLLLQQFGLGQKTVEFARGADKIQVELQIRAAYQKLENTEFELMVQVGQSRNKTLTLMFNQAGIPDGATIISRPISLLYIRPLESLFNSDDVTNEVRFQRFLCLGGPDETMAPLRQREQKLKDIGLGLANIGLERFRDGKFLDQQIRKTFPKLGNNSYDLMRRTSINRNAALLRLCESDSFPETNKILSLRISVIYIRPLACIEANQGNPADLTDDSFDQIVFCLGNPNEKFVPGTTRQNELKLLGLGKSVVTLGSSLDSRAVERVICVAYSRLQNVPFSLLRPTSSNEGSPLLALSYFAPIPEGQFIKEANRRILYILPLRNIDTDQVITDPYRPPSPHSVDEEIILHCLDETGIPATPAISSGDALPLNNEAEIPVQYLLELSEFRSSCWQEYADQTQALIIERDDLEDLLSIYKDPAFNFKKRLTVKFVGEPGRDLGAISKEFFITSMKLLRTKALLGKHPLFEGEMDHLLPTRNSLLLTAGHFKFVGKFIGHSVIQTGVGFIGLSQAAVSYIFHQEDAFFSDLTISERELPSYEIRRVIEVLKEIKMGVSVSSEDLTTTQEFLQEAGIFDVPNRENSQLFIDQLLFHYVLLSRAAYFESIREGMRQTGVFQYLVNRKHLWKTVFPTQASLKYSAADIIALIRYNGEVPPEIKECIESFIGGLGSDEIQNLLQAWTGWQVIPDEGLEIKINESSPCIFHACFNQLEIPTNITAETLKTFLHNSLMFGYVGFGTA